MIKTFQNIPFIKPIAFLSLINVAVIAVAWIFQNNLPPEIPLFYGHPRGQQELAQSAYIILPPAIVIAITLVNIVLIKIVKDSFIQKTLYGILVILTLLSTIAVVKIISLVGNI